MKSTLTAILALAAQRQLPCLLIGGNAAILLGVPRNTIDVDLLVPSASRSAWLDLMREMQYRLFHGADAFTQFEPGKAGMVALDLMFVDDRTWALLSAHPIERVVDDQSVQLPQVDDLLNLPVFDKPQKEWLPREISWKKVIKETEPVRRYYLEHYDSPEERLRNKNPKPFRME